VTVKVTVVWYETPYSFVDLYWLFGGTRALSPFKVDKIISPEKGGITFLRSVGACLPNYTISHPIIQQASILKVVKM
jgi:hypothetical protein